MSERWPVPVEPAGPVALGTMLWRYGGQLRVSVVCKATLALVPGEDMRVEEPLAVRRTEAHGNDDPRCSIVAPSDLVPRLARCDVYFVGHAYAPRGQEAKVVPVRIVVARPGGEVLMDKRLEVFGDRTARPGEPPSEPRPFGRMPIVYERAYGGIGWADNPLGIGISLDAKGLLRVPNVVHPAWQGGGVNPPGFAPIARVWPARRRLLGGLDHRALEAPVAELPETLDWNYFQAAPTDQRIDFLTGEEYILLEGLHSRHPVLRTRLPGLAVRATVMTPDGFHLPLSLRADTLGIFGDAERCTVTWRGSFPVPDVDIASRLKVVARLTSRGEAVELAERPPLSKTQVLSELEAAVPKVPANELVRTITLGDEDLVFAQNSDIARLLRRSAPPAPPARKSTGSIPPPRATLLSNPDADPLAKTEAPEEDG